MSLRCVAASTQGILNSSPPVVVAPFSLGIGFTMTAVGGAEQCLWSLGDTAVGNHYWDMYVRADTTIDFFCAAGGADATIDMATAVTTGARHYCVFRAISATNRRAAVLHPTGASVHGQNTTSRSPTGIDVLSVGYELLASAGAPTDSIIDEFWMTATDIQPGGGVLDEALLRQIARYGPMSVPHIRNALIEFLPLKDSMTGDKGDYYSSRGRQNWTNINGVRLVGDLRLEESSYAALRPWRRLAKAPVVVPPSGGDDFAALRSGWHTRAGPRWLLTR